MERRQAGRSSIDETAFASLWLGPLRAAVAVCDVSAGGARLRIGKEATSRVRAAVGEHRPCRLEIGDLGTLTAVPRWLAAGSGDERFLGTSLHGPESVAPQSVAASRLAGEAAAISWVSVFARRALLLHLGGRADEALRCRRRALQQTAAFVERSLQRSTLCGGAVSFLDETDTAERALAAAGDLSRLGAWSGASDAALAAATLRVVAHLERETPELAEALETQRRNAESSALPLAHWTAEALRALAEQHTGRRTKRAAAVLAHRDLSRGVDTGQSFPSASLIGVLSSALAVVPFTGSPSAGRRRRSVGRRRERRASARVAGA